MPTVVRLDVWPHVMRVFGFFDIPRHFVACINMVRKCGTFIGRASGLYGYGDDNPNGEKSWAYPDGGETRKYGMCDAYFVEIHISWKYIMEK